MTDSTITAPDAATLRTHVATMRAAADVHAAETTRLRRAAASLEQAAAALDGTLPPRVTRPRKTKGTQR